MNIKIILPILFLPVTIAKATPERFERKAYVKPIDKEAARMLAAVMWAEARGEGENGMRLVGEVAINRTANPDYPGGLCDVLSQPYQFAPPLFSFPDSVLQMAEGLLRAKPPHGFIYFCNPKTSTNKKFARLALRKGVQFGRHWFFE
jgi:peptidoglycan lytic transglycosylase